MCTFSNERSGDAIYKLLQVAEVGREDSGCLENFCLDGPGYTLVFIPHETDVRSRRLSAASGAGFVFGKLVVRNERTFAASFLGPKTVDFDEVLGGQVAFELVEWLIEVYVAQNVCMQRIEGSPCPIEHLIA